METSLASANAKLGSEPVVAGHARHVVTMLARRAGHDDIAQVSAYVPPFGPPAHAASVAASKLIHAALVDAEFMETGLDQQRYLQVEQRREVWQTTLGALTSALSGLDAGQQAWLTHEVRKLLVVANRLLKKDVDATSFHSSAPHIAKLEQAIR